MRAHQNLELPALPARWTLPIRALRWLHAVEISLVFYTGGPSRKTRQGKPVMENMPVKTGFKHFAVASIWLSDRALLSSQIAARGTAPLAKYDEKNVLHFYSFTR